MENDTPPPPVKSGLVPQVGVYKVNECILTSHCPATRGLLATDHVILKHGQVTWTTPELATLSPNYHTTSTGDVSALDIFNVHHCPTRRVFSGSGLELVTKPATIRYIYHSLPWPQEYAKGTYLASVRLMASYRPAPRSLILYKSVPP
ncbi:uncharacterized protein TNCV_675261 [Trichonephila clavipes]|nr:uncharacterized protein TNCV_675261 [Trichonephila clavipes]